jgi:hypothetical protein
MATVKKKLIQWKGDELDITLGKFYEINDDTIYFRDDDDFPRDAGLGLWHEPDEPEPVPPSARDSQIGGHHYMDKAIQPIDYILSNGLNFCEGNVVKYITRWKDKNGIADLKKAIHYIEFLIEEEEKNNGV